MKKNIISFFNNRILVIKFILVIVGVAFAVRLIDLQIVNGEMYREKSEQKMLRATAIEAPRGEVYDRNGIVLATNKLSYNVSIYKVGQDDENLNKTLLKLISILEKNNDEIYSSFPMDSVKEGFYSKQKKQEICTEYEIDGLPKDTELLSQLYYKYGIDKIDIKDERKLKLLKLRYEIGTNIFSLFNSVVLAKDISYNSMAVIEENKKELEGIEINVISKRYYPNRTLLAHTLGYVSSISREEYEEHKEEGYTYNSNIGKMGIESSSEKYLKGEDGIKRTEVDSDGNIASEYIYKEAKSGNNLTLTIDYRLQTVAEKNLKKVVKNIATGARGYEKQAEADAGAVVALDINSGDVLAMASYPNFDPNDFVSGIKYNKWMSLINNNTKPMFNRVISGTYSPGSTFKMLSALAGLNSGVITLNEKITDTGKYRYGNHPMCWVYSYYGRTHGSINVTQAIKVSCNCYFYEVGRRMGIDNLVKYAKMFGLGSKTGVELYGESEGIIAGEDKTKEWYFGDTLSAVIGQSYNSYTLIQLANYISTLANGGKLNKVTLIKDVKNSDNVSLADSDIYKYYEETLGYKFKTSSLKLNKKHVAAVVEGMKSVTSEQGGTAYITFKNSDIEVAGKTGTAQVSQGTPNGIFVGFAPIKNPQIAVVALVEHGDSGYAVANIVKPILEEYFNISKDMDKNTENINILKQNISY